MSIESGHPYEILDVFTDTPLQGNPLAVFTEGEAVPSRLMQATARELNLSETVFILPGDDQCDAQIRIFTPRSELLFAGHPTLGAAFVVGALQDLATVSLRTGAGIVPISLTREHGEIVYGEMEQPIPSHQPYRQQRELLAALGCDASQLPIERYSNGPEHVLVALESPDAVAALRPDVSALAALGEIGVSCFALLGERAEPEADPGPGRRAQTTGPVRVKTRMFAPGLGVAEDPATGSAAGPLVLHLARHGWAAPGHTVELTQGVEIQRPSLLIARVDGSPEAPERIVVGGAAVVVGRGQFRLQ